MRTLAFDIGEVRTGIAVSDTQGRVATPVCVLPTQEVQANAPTFQRTIEDWEPDQLLFGLPLTLQGEEGPQAERVRQIAETISTHLNLPTFFTDERLSSAEAKKELRQMGYDEKHMRGKVDMLAAAGFLQAWLDAQTTTNT